MRRIFFTLVCISMLGLSVAMAQTAQPAAKTKKLVPARRCLVYEDDPEAMPATPTGPTAKSASTSVHPIVLPAKTKSTPTAIATRSSIQNTTRSSNTRFQPKLLAANSIPSRPVSEAPVAAPAPYAANPIHQLRGNARVLLIFAPSADSAPMQEEMRMVEHHQLELTHRNTVVVPILNARDSKSFDFNGEHLDPGTAADLASARQKFGIKPDQFAVVLLDEQGIERTRWLVPVAAPDLDDQIDEIDSDGGVVHSLHDQQK